MEPMTYFDALCLSVFVCGAMLATFVLTLKVWDAARAWRYNRKQARRRELDQAFADGCAFVMGEYAERPVQTYRVVLATPDRPKVDSWMLEALQEAADLIADVEESGI